MHNGNKTGMFCTMSASGQRTKSLIAKLKWKNEDFRGFREVIVVVRHEKWKSNATWTNFPKTINVEPKSCRFWVRTSQLSRMVVGQLSEMFSRCVNMKTWPKTSKKINASTQSAKVNVKHTKLESKRGVDGSVCEYRGGGSLGGVRFKI